MEITQLKYFCVVARKENITAAAKDLFISQPTLSQTIARLESNVGTPLFIREKGRIRLNVAGKAFLQHAETALAEVEKATLAARECTDFGEDELRVASTAGDILGLFAADFATTSNNNIHIREYFLSNSRIYSMLNDLSLDFAISIDPPFYDNVDWQQLFREPLYFILSKDHPLANTGPLSLQDLSTESFLSYDTGFNRNYTQHLCNNIGGFYPNIKMISNEPASILSAVAANVGISIVFAHDLLYLQTLLARQDLCFAKMTAPDYMCSVGILSLRSHPISGYLKTFYDYCVARLQTTAFIVSTLPQYGRIGDLSSQLYHPT